MPLYDMYCTRCGYEGEQLAKPGEKVPCPQGCESPLERAAIQAFAVNTRSTLGEGAITLHSYIYSKNGVPQRQVLLPPNAFHEHIRGCPAYDSSDVVVQFAARRDMHTSGIEPQHIVVEKADGSGYAIGNATSVFPSVPSDENAEKPN